METVPGIEDTNDNNDNDDDDDDDDDNVMPMTIIVRNYCGKDPKRNSTLLFILLVEMVVKDDSWNIIATFMIMMTIRR